MSILYINTYLLTYLIFLYVSFFIHLSISRSLPQSFSLWITRNFESFCLFLRDLKKKKKKRIKKSKGTNEMIRSMLCKRFLNNRHLVKRSLSSASSTEKDKLVIFGTLCSLYFNATFNCDVNKTNKHIIHRYDVKRW